MKNSTVVIGLVVAIVVMATLAVQQGCGGVPFAISEAPAHYFLPAKSGPGDAVWCDFSNRLGRSAMSTLWSKPLQPCSLGLGWTYPGKGGVASIARTGTFDIDLPSDDWSYLLLTVKAFRDPDTDRQQTMNIEVNGRPLGSVTVPKKWTTVGFHVPAGVLCRGSNRFSTSFGYRVSQSSRSGERDHRLFSVHLREAALVRSSEYDLSPRAMRRLMKKSASRSGRFASVFDRRSGRFVLASPGTLVLPTEIPDDADILEVDVRAPASSAPDGPRIALRIQSLNSDAMQRVLLPVESENDSRGFAVLRVPLSGFAGEKCLIMVDVPPRSDRKAVVLSPLRVIPSNTSVSSENPAKDPASNQPILPDIVLITLDAARADHFSCYGYERKTSPSIDRLAEESLVFRNAFALAPYTLCSVPTMVTGLSFLDHQITDHGQRLSDQATTLAEYLKTRGYRTAGFSATPNNSRALGTDQGYDVFVESWKVVARKDSIDPFLLSGLALQWLAENSEEAPLHLQLHFVPPHAPYNPAPEFDRFTDPTYQGRCNGSNETIAALDSSKWLPAPNDLAHVVALYDGNLRAADEAVSQVLQALRRRQRWKNTVVLVTSDHGEAFLEHGRMGHNSTVFDEMLRVPFILRIPWPVDTMATDLDGLVTLADIVPTLLSTAGVEAEPGLAGFNILGSATQGSPPRRSGLVIRTTGEPPLYAFRTAQWKLMLSGSGLGALYCLASDPEERRDLSLENRAFFAGLGHSLTRRLAAQPRFEPVINPDRLPDQDVEMLKALGYVQ